MNVILSKRMDVDEFLRWCLAQEQGRYELERGRIIMMNAQNAGHIRTKQRLAQVLQSALEKSGVPFYSLGDGMKVRLPENRSYEPDALVAPMPAVPDDALEVLDPVAVFKVLSPTPKSIRRDLNEKVVGCALLATIQHYLIIDPEARVVLHYRRHGDYLVPSDAPVEDVLRLDAVGIEMPVEDMLGPPRSST